jgi:hypothetical protein
MHLHYAQSALRIPACLQHVPISFLATRYLISLFTALSLNRPILP